MPFLLNVYDVAMIVGRFQTFHKGHQHLIETALKICDRVIIMVGSAQECGTERNPLNVETRIKMIRQIYDDERRVMVYALSDLTDENDVRPEWGRYLLDNIDRYIYKNPEVYVFGNDEPRGFTWFEPEDLKNTTQLIVNRADIPISATMLRDLMVLDERRKWMQWVDPKLHKFYDTLRAELMSVAFYQERAVELRTNLKDYTDELLKKLS